MELTKQDNQMAKGLAIIGMVLLHLFCRLGDLPYEPILWVGSVPLIYYFGLFGDMCIVIYCFCSGYAQMLMIANGKKNRLQKLLKFLVNFWIVVVLFSIPGLLFDPSGNIPGSWGKFLGNLGLYGLSYNGAWWFVMTYVLLVFAAPVLAWIVQKMHPILILGISGMLYAASYVFRFMMPVEFSNAVVQWIWTQCVLFASSQFAFVVGMMFYRYQVISKLRSYFESRVCARRILCFGIPAAMFIGHGIVQSAGISPITGLLTLVCFYLWHKPSWIQKLMLFLGKHSTNIWLVHMFFYLVLFKGLVFHAKYPIFVFAFMMVLCIASSYAIQYIEDVIYKVYPKFLIKI